MAMPGDEPSGRSRWLDAVSVLAVIVTVIVTARQLRPLVEAGAFVVRTGEPQSAVPTSAWVRAGAWVAISVAVFLRRRTVAAWGAWAATMFEVAVAAPRIGGDPRYGVPLDLLVWPAVLAVTAAVLLTGSAAVARAPGTVTRRGYWLLTAAAAVAALMAAAIPLLGEVSAPAPADSADPGWSVGFTVSSELARAVAGATFAAVLVLALSAAGGAERAVRSRLYTLVAAGTAGFVAIQFGLPRPFGALDFPVLSRPAQAVVLVLLPGLVLCAGLVSIRSAARSKMVGENDGIPA
jgi:hypothetical protein